MTTKKTLILSVVTLATFFLSLILLANDYMNMVPVTLTITTILFIYMAYKIFSKKDPTSVYKRTLKNILKSYDSILVYSKNKYDYDSNNVIRVKTMDNLIKAQEIINKPIIYVDLEKSSKFILKDDERLLVYTLKI